MPSGDESDSVKSESGDQSRRQKWKGKLLSKAGKIGKAVDKVIKEKNAASVDKEKTSASVDKEKDLSDFLHGFDSNAVSKPRVQIETVPKPSANSLSPNIQSGKASNPNSRPGSSQSMNLPIKYFRKRRLPRGVHVAFTTEAPVIIGEGGDEAEVPSREVMRFWKDSNGVPRLEQSSSSSSVRKDAPPALVPSALLPAHGAGPQLSPPLSKNLAFNRKPVAGLDLKGRSEEREAGMVLRQSQRTNWVPSMPEKSNERVPYPLDSPTSSTLSPPSTIDSFSTQFPDDKTGNSNSPGPLSASPARPVFSPPLKTYERLNLSQSTVSSEYTNTSPDDPRTRDTIALSIPVAEVRSVPGTGNAELVSPMSVYSEDPFEDPVSPNPEQTVSPANIPEANQKFDDFYSCMQHLGRMFEQEGQTSDAYGDYDLASWIRTSIWWFLKGRIELKSHLRSLNAQRSDSSSSQMSPQAIQGYVNLAKTWWIVNDVFPDQLRRLQLNSIDDLGLPLLQDAHKSLRDSMRSQAIFMEHSRQLPPYSLTMENLDTKVWIDYPSLQPEILALTADVDPETLLKRAHPDEKPFFAILLGDTDRHFSYGQIFLDVEIISNYEGLDEHQLPSVLSMLRERSGSRIEVTIVSQDGQINLHIQSDKNLGLTWDDVEWKARSHSLRIHLAQDFELALRLWEDDYKALWGIYDYNCMIDKNWQEKEDEVTWFDDVIDTFHYLPGSGRPINFPSKPVKSCRIRLFEQSHIESDASGQRTLYTGHRLSIATPPQSKELYLFSNTFKTSKPVLFSYLRGEGGLPALLLSLRDQTTKSNMILTFSDLDKRNDLHSMLKGTFHWPDEFASSEIPLDAFSITPMALDLASTPKDLPFVPGITWKQIRIINKPGGVQSSKKGITDSFRICMECNFGSITDRVNSGPGQLQISLDVADTTRIKLLRLKQVDLTISFAENLLGKGDWQRLRETLSAMANFQTSRTYRFHSLQDLHTFQGLVTGYSVFFDGLASSFTVSHRRSMLTAGNNMQEEHVRLQVVQHDGHSQLIAIFSGFALGRCINFPLSGNDTFESSNKSGKYYTRLVDAKFNLKSEKSIDWEFICLDDVTKVNKQEDIIIGFETEKERDLFASALPASSVKSSRLSSFIKK